MIFCVDYKPNIEQGCALYSKSENSFLYESDIVYDFSFMIGAAYTSFEANAKTGKICCVTGFNPSKLWKKGSVIPPKNKSGILYVKTNEPLISGTGIQYAKDWITIYDCSTGWIFLGEDMSMYSDDFVMFAENTIAGITNQKINSIFIKPTFVN